jgi:RNA-directed DNA polymerase
VVEADIRGFFDNLSQQWLMRMLAERIDDEPFLRLIKKWLKAGVLDTDGQVLRPESGTPQGGIVSPVWAKGVPALCVRFVVRESLAAPL